MSFFRIDAQPARIPAWVLSWFLFAAGIALGTVGDFFNGGALQDLVSPLHALASTQVPLILAMGLVALLGNASALHRFASLARALRHGAEEGHHAGR